MSLTLKALAHSRAAHIVQSTGLHLSQPLHFHTLAIILIRSWLAALLLTLVFVPQAQAQPASETSALALIETLRARALALVEAGKAESALKLVATHEADYVGIPDFDYLLGAIALAAGSNSMAVSALERVVLVQPSYAGAWLDLAIAHFRLGELDTAESMLQHVNEHFAPSPKLRAEIADVLGRIKRARMTKGIQADLGVFAGQTSNANYGLAVSALQINFFGTPVSVPLEQGYQPRPDRFNEVRTSLTRRFDLAAGERSEISGTLRYRMHAKETGHDQHDAALSGMWRLPITWPVNEKAHLFAGGSLRELTTGDRSVKAAQLSAGLSLPAGGCQLRGRVDYEHRLYAGASAYDAAIPWLGVSTDCEQGVIQYGAQLRIGRDFALNDRPGGDTLRAESVAFGRWQVRPGLQLGALLVYALARDTGAYSALLADGDPRWVRRMGQKLEMLWVPGPNPRSPWMIVLELENIRDRSNIGLSTLKLTQFQIGLNYRYF